VQPPDPMMAIQNRLAKLEEEKNHQSADVILTRIRILLNKTDATFNKDEAFDLLIELKAAAATEKHKDLPHYQAVFMAMRQKVAVPASQFRKYLAALLGDKHQEKKPRKRKKLYNVYNTPSWETQAVFHPVHDQKENETRRVRWVRANGSPSQETVFSRTHIHEVLDNHQPPLLEVLGFRDPDQFLAGEIHRHPEVWSEILKGHQYKDMILDWLRNGVDVTDFSTRFKGVFRGTHYDTVFPPPTVLKNLQNCKKFTMFITNTLGERIKAGAVGVWGRVGETEPPHLVLPLTVEPTKPRLCLDARFLNMWMKDCPFSLDRLTDIKSYVYKGSFMTKCDDKSGYDHVLLSESSQQYFGFEWAGWWLVSKTLPFGWKESAFIYQTLGAAVASFFRNIGIPCSIYIDDRLTGELITHSGPWSVPVEQRTQQFSLRASQAAIYLVCDVLVSLGYFLGFSKCVLTPVKQLEYLGFLVDSELQAFSIPLPKVVKFAELREAILRRQKTVPMKTLQRFQGKCISFSIAVPAAKLYIRNICAAIASAHDSLEVKMTKPLIEEVSHWRFLDSWTGHVPWRNEKHWQMTITSDASGSGWSGVIHLPKKELQLRDYWNHKEISLNISTKETLALARILQATPEQVRDCRIDAYTDSQVLIDTWNREGSKSPELTEAIKELFNVVSQRNLHLALQHIPTQLNKADMPSRCLSKLDSMLSPKAWARVQSNFGGIRGHSVDLMALDTNAQQDFSGQPLPHFTPFPTPESAGVNLFAQSPQTAPAVWDNPYVFPPFNLVGPVLRFLLPFHIPFTIIVPRTISKTSLVANPESRFT
ncbi:hypothetical protein QZH41_019748, partial [Actinostola sp. cb2023]